MIINTDLLVNNPEIIEGLMTGEMTRYGGVIRYASGTEKAGQIVRHLAESPDFTNQLMKSPNLLGINSSLSQIMGLSQIAAGATVLNLGVSIAGFAYMGFKLHQVQQSLNHLQQTMEAGFSKIETGLRNLDDKVTEGFTVVLKGLNHLDNRLNIVSGQLAYLYLLVQDNRQKQESLAKGISHIHKAILMDKIAGLNAKLYTLKRFPNESIIGAIEEASSVRLFLGGQAMQSTPELDAELMLNTDISLQGWAVATATEANLLLQIGEHQEAKQLLAEEVPKFKQIANNWGEKLISNEQSSLSTSYRFNATPFKSQITPERMARISQISPSDHNLNDEQIRWKKSEVEVEFQMSYAQEKYAPEWYYQQIALAEYLDSLSELNARLDSLQYFAQLCEDKGVKSSKELLPNQESQEGLYLLDISNTHRPNSD